MPDVIKKYVPACISFMLYVWIGYFIDRHQSFELIIAYTAVFSVYIYLLSRSELDISWWVYTGILFRASLLLSLPSLSDDFYRFIWDGRLIGQGIHPFADIPSSYVNSEIPGLDQALYENLNSKNYFTVYPPICQLIFWLSTLLGGKSVLATVISMRGFILLSEIGTLMLLPKILSALNIKQSRVLVYALNPLVILELTGNLHFEAVMIFLFLASMVLLLRKKLILSSVMFGFSVCVKFLPLVFLPALIQWTGIRKGLLFCLVCSTTIFVLFLPLADRAIISGLSEGLGYYFQKFEFNASVYYLVRAAGFWIFGFNIIQIAGWVMAFTAFCLILLIALRHLKQSHHTIDNRFFATLMWCLLIYFTFTTTLHPWYLTSLLVLSLFTGYRFVILWTALIFLTYIGYDEKGFSENLWIVAIEYLSVAAYLSYELLWERHRITS